MRHDDDAIYDVLTQTRRRAREVAKWVHHAHVHITERARLFLK